MSEKEITIEKFVLSQSRDTKIKWLNNALEEDNFSAWFGLAQILLKHPIHKGGIETEVIDAIFRKHNQCLN
jgi:hypothetical protein